MWDHSLRYLRIRRRDAICTITMCVCSVFSAVSLVAAAYVVFFLAPALRSRSDDTYVACTNVLSSADSHMLQQMSHMQSYCASITNYLSTIEPAGSGSCDDSCPVVAPVDVLGTGRTKSVRHDYHYVDVRYSDGSVRRHYVKD